MSEVMSDDEYVNVHAAEICPFCRSDNIVAGKLHGFGMTAWSRNNCRDCKEEWDDIFKLTGFERISEL